MESKDVSSNISTEILQARLEELRAENVRLLLKQEQLILENFEKDKLRNKKVININHYQWKKHLHGLVQLPIASCEI